MLLNTRGDIQSVMIRFLKYLVGALFILSCVLGFMSGRSMSNQNHSPANRGKWEFEVHSSQAMMDVIASNPSLMSSWKYAKDSGFVGFYCQFVPENKVSYSVTCSGVTKKNTLPYARFSSPNPSHVGMFRTKVFDNALDGKPSQDKPIAMALRTEYGSEHSENGAPLIKIQISALDSDYAFVMQFLKSSMVVIKELTDQKNHRELVAKSLGI